MDFENKLFSYESARLSDHEMGILVQILLGVSKLNFETVAAWFFDFFRNFTYTYVYLLCIKCVLKRNLIFPQKLQPIPPTVFAARFMAKYNTMHNILIHFMYIQSLLADNFLTTNVGTSVLG